MTDGNWGGARPGAGRKPREAGKPRQAISVTLSQAAYAVLRDHADRAGLTLSEACEHLILAAAHGPGWDLGAVVPQTTVAEEVDA